MKVRFLFLYVFVLFNVKMYSQNIYSEIIFHSPLDIPMLLSGTFGELRSSHFHSGIDIKTQQTIGHNLYAIEDGYVSRIKIQSGAYGNAIYITHYNGYMSVFGHISEFSPEIQQYVREYQYSVQKHEVDMYLQQGKSNLKKGDIVALSGNSGRSSGPHLHFEVRNVRNQVPVNPMLFNFDIKDNIPPKITRVALYPESPQTTINDKCSKQLFVPIKSDASFILKDTINVSGSFSLGIETFDYLNNTNSRCGVYNIQLLVDSNKIFETLVDAVPFPETRYINSHLDFELLKRDEIKIQKLSLDPNNNLSIYEKIIDNGIIDLKDTLIHTINLKVYDVYLNESVLSFNVKRSKVDSATTCLRDTNYLKVFTPFNKNTYKDDNIEIILSEKSLYDTIYFNYTILENKSDPVSDTYIIQNKFTPSHKKFILKLKPKSLNPELEDKYALAEFDNDKWVTYPGYEDDGYIVCKTRYFGQYKIVLDTIAPEITPINITKDQNLTGIKSIQFKVKDNFNNIEEYNGYIDGKWVLFQYDAKNDLVFYEFDEHCSTNQSHEIELYIRDLSNNIATYYTTFYY